MSSFCDKIIAPYCESCSHPSAVIEECAECLYNLDNKTAKYEYENICHIITKEIVMKENLPWFNKEIVRANREKRKGKDCGRSTE